MSPKILCFAVVLAGAACSGDKTPPPAQPVEAPPPKPPPPSGPTRTDFKTIAKRLVQRCVGGGWIDEWRAGSADPDVAKPKIFLEGFEDRTKKDLDPSYLASVLSQRLRLSGVFDMRPDGAAVDFVGRGRLLRMSERVGSERISVYTAVLDLVDPKSDRVAYSCEATVRGEL